MRKTSHLSERSWRGAATVLKMFEGFIESKLCNLCQPQL